MSTARARRITIASLMLAAVVVAAVGVSGSSASSAKGAKLDPATIKIWYLGDAESPGFEKWMKSSITAFQAANPGVKVQAEVKGVDTWTATQATACQAKSGPDIWYQWAGGYAMEQAWNGCTVAMNDFWSKGQIATLTNQEEWVWQGKIWGAPQFLQNFPIVYNKDLFKKAGLDPNKPPTTWTAFVAALKKLKGAGVTPMGLGLKDGWGGEIASNFFIKQQFDNWNQLKQKVVNGSFTDPQWQGWIDKVVSIKPYFNDDVNSIPFAQALARFASGDVAMVFGSPGLNATIADQVAKGKNIGVMQMPVYGTKKLAGSFSTGASGFAITSWSKVKDQAAAFLLFQHSPKQVQAWFADTSTFPSDTQFKPSIIKVPQLKQMYGWVKTKNGVYPNSFIPVQLDVEGNFAAWQGIFAGTLTAKKAAALYQGVITKWRSSNKAVIVNWKTWATS
jgi:raffinose/stachyose/melibiose transport system substrate-binding protein